MELFAVLAAWVDAAEQTERMIRQKIAGESEPRRATGIRAYFGSSVHMTGGLDNTGIISQISEEFRQQLTPMVSLIKRLTPEQRRQAARRTLRNMMSVYCPELLSDFEKATDRRREWVEANRAALMKALAAPDVDYQSLRNWAEEAQETRQGLQNVQEELSSLIRDKFPMGVDSLGRQ
ncbi:hypothetical protein ACIPWI_37870 [Streptomyces sp. NPDC090046]|uniref:hypothetical protein n=1 Tax=Streptomyces sp. NPDC090046 TaxID=3365928 RepID=UPI003824F391